MTDKPNKKKITIKPYFNSKFPPILQKNFKNEFISIWKELQDNLLEACKSGAVDFNKLVTIIPQTEVFVSIYSPSKKQKEMIVTVLMRLLFEEKMTTALRLFIMKQVGIIIEKNTFKNLKLNWKSVYKFLDENLFNPKVSIQYASGFSEKYFGKYSKFAKNIRIFYPEEAISEVLVLLRQTVQPFFSCVSKGVCLLTIFFHTSSKFSKQHYEKWIPELFEIWSWKSSSIWDRAFLCIFAKLAR